MTKIRHIKVTGIYPRSGEVELWSSSNGWFNIQRDGWLSTFMFDLTFFWNVKGCKHFPVET